MSDLQEIRTENNPKVTIVVPIYNVEQYIYIRVHLLDCIELIAQRSYSNFEAILINDGSMYNYAKICIDWIQQRKDPRFGFFNKPPRVGFMDGISLQG